MFFIESIEGSSFLVAQEHGLRSGELAHVRQDDLVPQGQALDDLDLGDADGADRDLALDRDAVLDDVDLPPAAALQEWPAWNLQHVRLRLEDHPHGHALKVP